MFIKVYHNYASADGVANLELAGSSTFLSVRHIARLTQSISGWTEVSTEQWGTYYYPANVSELIRLIEENANAPRQER